MKVTRYFLFVLLFSIICGCDNDDNASLFFEKEYYERPLSENSQEIVFSGGSSNLSVEVSDNDVLAATVGTGNIKIKTKKKGVVNLVVRDGADNTEGVRLYDISNSSEMFLQGAIPTVLDFSWTDEHEATTNSRSASPVTMNAVDSVTGDVYYFSVDSAEMPYGILN